MEPTLGFKVVGSTDAYKVRLLGFLELLLNAPVLHSSLASDQPVLAVCCCRLWIDRRIQAVYVGSTGDSIPCCYQADFVCLLPRSISLVPKVFNVRVALL